MQQRKISEEELRKVLQIHRSWASTSPHLGESADLSEVNLAGASLPNVDLRGANLFRTTLKKAHLPGAEFIGTNLKEADLSHADLIHAQFQEANLVETNLSTAKLGAANFQKAILTGANLKDADLPQANFKNATLLGTVFRDADLHDADLTDSIGLLAKQLAGTDVSSAKLPNDIHEFAGLKQVEELSKSARRLFTSILLGCVYCWLTIFSTKDAQLLTNSSSTPLPIIQAPIPIAGFYGVAPFILLSLFIYFHLYLQRLWRELAGLPAVFPDGKPLDEKASPWLLNSLVRAHVPRLKTDRPPLSRLEVGLSVLLGWWVVPFTTILFWLRSLQRHDWLLTGFQVGWTVMAILCAAGFYKLAKRTLSGRQPAPTRFKETWKCIAPYKEIVTRFGALVALAVLITFFLLVVSDGAINLGKEMSSSNAGSENSEFFYRSYVPPILRLIGARANADFEEQDISTKPLNWFLREDVDLPRIVHGAQLKGADLRWANAGGAFLMKADLREADLRGTLLTGANLHEAQMSGANLQFSHLFGANLLHANLSEAKLQNADLTIADIKQGNLSKANLQGAILHQTDLQGAALNFANLQNADLTGASLQNSFLKEATLRGADFRGADLTDAKGLTQAQLDQACVDEKTKLPPSLQRPKLCQNNTSQ